MYQGPGNWGACCFSPSCQGNSPSGKDCTQTVDKGQNPVQYFPVQIHSKTSYNFLLSYVSGSQSDEKLCGPSCPYCTVPSSTAQENKKDLYILYEAPPLAFKGMSG